MLGAVVIELDADRIDAGEHLFVGFGIPCAHIGAETVEGRVDAEHDDFDEAALGGFEGCFSIVAAESDVLDFAFSLELFDIFDVGAVDEGVPFGGVVYDVDHAHFDMVCAEACEEVFKAFFALFDIAGALVGFAVPPAADMALDDHLVATALEGVADVVADDGVGIVDVDIVDAAIDSDVHEGTALRGVYFAEGGTAYADFAHLEFGAAQLAVCHAVGGLFGASAGHHDGDSEDKR